jgi:hypothetical protein
LAALDAPELHRYIIEQDIAALVDIDEEGRPAPLFLLTLDLCQWMLILSLEIEESGKGLKQLHKVHDQLADILDNEAGDLEMVLKNTKLIDVAICRVNPQESSPSVMVRGINVASVEKVALEDMSSSINTS